MKNIVVRKNKSQRVGLCILSAIMLSISIALCIFWCMLARTAILMLFPILPGIFVSLIALYYNIWQVNFSSNRVIIKSLFFRTKTYSYYQIIDVYIANSYTLEEHVCMKFSDGKCIRFRLVDENAS